LDLDLSIADEDGTTDQDQFENNLVTHIETPSSIYNGPTTMTVSHSFWIILMVWMKVSADGTSQMPSPQGDEHQASTIDEVECDVNGICSSNNPKKTDTTGVNEEDNHQQQQQQQKPQCTVYMAPSTLGDSVSMGIYTGVDLEPETVIPYPEIAIPLLFREWGDHTPGFHDGVLWDRYIWEGDVVNLESYDDTNRHASKAVFVPGVGCTVNSILDMNNIESTHGSEYDTAGLHRSQDPGSGAFTPYYNSKTVAIDKISAGAELFANYGDYWIPDIPGAQVMMEALLDEAEEFLRGKYYPFIKEKGDQLTTEMKQKLWEFTAKDFPIYNKAMTNLPRNVQWVDVETSLQEHENETEFSIVRDFIRKQSIRSTEWLQEHGYCQDHLKPGRSTIPQAGRGAFAARHLPAGTVIGFAPLIHIGIHGRDIFTVTVGEDEMPRKQYDLIINYSFGHRNSTVLLTPYGAMVNYINHGGKTSSNVMLRWPDKELISHKPEFLKRTPQMLRDTVDKIGLSFEYVAMRDIQEGEEVLMDYGDKWEQAWNDHVKSWEPLENSIHYVHSSEWGETIFRTLQEQDFNPYPPNLHTMCQESFTYAKDGTYQWVDVLRPHPFRVYCDILERYGDEEKSLYTVSLFLDDGNTVVVQNVPNDGVFLYDKAFSADWHLPNVFRHEIAIPDNLMPDAWMNGPPPLPNFNLEESQES
jgi:hypothetical protein